MFLCPPFDLRGYPEDNLRELMEAYCPRDTGIWVTAFEVRRCLYPRRINRPDCARLSACHQPDSKMLRMASIDRKSLAPPDTVRRTWSKPKPLWRGQSLGYSRTQVVNASSRTRS